MLVFAEPGFGGRSELSRSSAGILRLKKLNIDVTAPTGVHGGCSIVSGDYVFADEVVMAQLQLVSKQLNAVRSCAVRQVGRGLCCSWSCH